MAMSPPLDNNSNQGQEGDEYKTKTKLKDPTVDVTGVSGDGTACNTNTTGYQFINNLNQYVEGHPKGFSVTVEEQGDKHSLRISAPLRDGHTWTTVKVLCDRGHVENFCYKSDELDVQNPKYKTKLRIENAPPIGDIVQTHNQQLNETLKQLKECYGAILKQLHKGCLLLEFEHSSENEAKGMVADLDNVTGIFKDFAHKCGFPAEKVTVRAEYEFVDQQGQAQADGGSIVQFADVPKTDSLDKGREEITKQPDCNPISDPRTVPKRKMNVDMTTSDPSTVPKRRINVDMTTSDSDEVKGHFMGDSECTGDGNQWSEVHMLKDSDDLDSGYIDPMIFQDPGLTEYQTLRIDLDSTVSLDHWSDQESMSYEVKRQISGLRNYIGGRLKIQRKQKEIHADFLDCFLPQCLDACLQDDEFCDDVYTLEEEEDLTTIDAKICSKLITLDYHTKIARGKDLINLNRRQMIELIHGRHNRLLSEAKIRGNSHDLKTGKTIAFKQEENPEVVSNTSQFVKRLFDDLNLREYISAFSKNKDGGSYIIPLKLPDEQKIMSTLHDHIMKNMIVLITSHGQEPKWSRPPEDLTKIVFHSRESIEGKCLLEVSVRPFHGIVFFDENGPESYRLNYQKQLVRLTRDEWLRRMSE